MLVDPLTPHENKGSIGGDSIQKPLNPFWVDFIFFLSIRVTFGYCKFVVTLMITKKNKIIVNNTCGKLLF